jgi:hypothetical protein
MNTSNKYLGPSAMALTYPRSLLPSKSQIETLSKMMKMTAVVIENLMQ